MRSVAVATAVAAASMVEVVEVFAEAVVASGVEDSVAGVHSAGARHGDSAAAAADSAATLAGLAAITERVDLVGARIAADPIPAERGLSEVQRIAEAHPVAVTAGTVAAPMEANREDTPEARIGARPLPGAVALRAAQCAPRMHRGPSLTGSGIRLAAHRAEVRHSPGLVAQRAARRRECATLQRQLPTAGGTRLVPRAAHAAAR
ncbi:MAG TPA: hypothetical protein VG322_04815 [Candidatus Acidoferrales bacterium]|nr:hypothetical protein [Candidatus Acidoferrales bacterium]